MRVKIFKDEETQFYTIQLEDFKDPSDCIHVPESISRKCSDVIHNYIESVRIYREARNNLKGFFKKRLGLII